MTTTNRSQGSGGSFDSQLGAGARPTTADTERSERTVFLARQPIFDGELEVYGYELLFRSGQQNNCSLDDDDGSVGTRTTVTNALNIMGLDHLVGGRKAFINLTRRLLLQQFYAVLPKSLAVVELPATVAPDDEVIAACEAMKRDDYLLALDNFVYYERCEPLLALADIVKVDFKNTPSEQRRELIVRQRRPGLTFLAERIEEQQEYEEAAALGYSLFQGYFFARPKMVEGRDFVGEKQKYLLFMQEVHSPEIDFARLEEIVKGEASLSVKLLRYLNSPSLGVREQITSIKQALVMLGEKPLRKWASLVALTCLGADKPSELIRLCLARACFCESLRDELQMPDRELDLFMLGLLSALDAMLDCRMSQLLEPLPIAEDVKSTLLGGSGPLGKLYMLVQACERGDWKSACMLGRMLGISEDRINDAYSRSLRWADEVMQL